MKIHRDPVLTADLEVSPPMGVFFIFIFFTYRYLCGGNISLSGAGLQMVKIIRNYSEGDFKKKVFLGSKS